MAKIKERGRSNWPVHKTGEVEAVRASSRRRVPIESRLDLTEAVLRLSMDLRTNVPRPARPSDLDDAHTECQTPNEQFNEVELKNAILKRCAVLFRQGRD